MSHHSAQARRCHKMRTTALVVNEQFLERKRLATLAEGSYRSASRSWSVSARLRLQKARTGRQAVPGAWALGYACRRLVPGGKPFLERER